MYRKNYLNDNTLDFLTALLLITCSVVAGAFTSHFAYHWLRWVMWKRAQKTFSNNEVLLKMLNCLLSLCKENFPGGYYFLCANQDWIKKKNTVETAKIERAVRLMPVCLTGEPVSFNNFICGDLLSWYFGFILNLKVLHCPYTSVLPMPSQ